MSKSGNGEDYPIGFGKPPKPHQFKKGQSGNPKGRPKKTKGKEKPPRFGDGTIESYLEQEVFRDLQLYENGKPVALSAGQAVLRSLVLEGVKGGRLAKRQVYELLRREEREAAERAVERYEHWAKFKAEADALIQKCRKEARPVPRFYPHPDDILLDEDSAKVHFLGPRSADQAIPFIRGALTRDWLFARSMLKGTNRKGSVQKGDEDKDPSSANVVAMLIERALPPSFQRTDADTAVFLSNLMSLGKRQLRDRIDALAQEILELPLTIEERLEERRKSSLVLETLGATFEEVAKIAAEKEQQET